MTNENKAIEASQKPQHPAVQVKHWLNQRSDALAEWCSESVDPLTLIRVGSRLVAKEAKFQNPKTWPSLYMALITAAQLGLDPDGPRGEAYLIPYWDRDAGCELVQLMPGYRGIMRLVTNSPDVKSIRSQVVYEGDDFSMDLMDPDDPLRNFHRVSVGAERGKAVGVYSRVTYEDGSHDCEFANWSEVDKARSSSKGKSPAWEKWPEQMARKFIIKRHSNQLPLDGVARQAISIDNIASDSAAADARAIIDVDDVIEGAPEPAKLAEPESGLAAKLAAKKDKRKPPATSKELTPKELTPKGKAHAKAMSAKEAAKKKKAAKAEEPAEEPPLVNDDVPFGQCGLCGEPTPEEICDECTAANEASE